MVKVLFVCYGNICRSPMAEFILKNEVKKRSLENDFYIESAATSNEEIGNPLYYLAESKLHSEGIEYDEKYARQLNKDDYEKFDYIIAMEDSNIKDIMRIIGKDKKHKVYKLMDFTNTPKNIDDPWYSRNFDKAYEDILEGCKAFLKFIDKKL